MPKTANNKLKMLYVMKILLENTDEEHRLSPQEIIARLEAFGISAERKSVYDDIESLRTFGLDVVCQRGKANEYYIGQRDWQLAELKLLVDAVQSSKFITERKSMELISKLEGLASKPQAGELRRSVHVVGRVKGANENVYYNVDAIHQAINSRSALAFKYIRYGLDKSRVLRRGGETYLVTPFALMWDDENYYLVAYDARGEKIKHYRVDKMLDIRPAGAPPSGLELIEGFDIAEYAKRHFGMFGGNIETVRLWFSADMVDVVLDRFGKDITLIREGEGFCINAQVAVSPIFIGWVLSLGPGARIVGPERVRKQVVVMLEEALKAYSSSL